MSSKKASWRAPGSILEAPGLDFGGLGAPNATQELTKSQPSQPGTTLPAKQLKTIQKSNQKSAEICRELAETRQLSATLFLDGGTGKPRLAKKEGAAVTPPGGFQSAAHRRCAQRARRQSHRPQPKLQTNHKGPI